MASELESDLQDNVDWGRKRLLDFNAGKIQLVSFDQSNNNGTIDVKMGGSALEEKPYLKILGSTFSFKLDWIGKTTSRKIGALIRSMKFLSPEAALYLLCSVSINLPYGYAWNAVVISELVLLAATWNCLISYKNRYAGLDACLEPLAHRQNVSSLSLLYRYYFGRCLSELAQLVSFPYSRGRSTCYSDRSQDFSVTIPRCYKDV